MSEWEKEKIRQSTLYIESEPDDNDLDGYYEYNVEEEKKKKREKHLDVDDVMALIYIIIWMVSIILISVGVVHRFEILTVIGLILMCVNIIIGGLYGE